MTETKVTLSQFHADALKFSEKLVSDEEIRPMDRTYEFLPHLRKEIKKGKLVSIQILGRVAGGKSTIAGYIVSNVNAFLGREMSLEYILTDQIAFAEFVNKFTGTKVCVQVDEWNPMSYMSTLPG